MALFRISQGIAKVVDVAQVDEIEPAIRASRPGRHQIDQIERDPLPSGQTSRRWGIAIKARGGSVVIERDPWTSDAR
jgi:hypothetical protein